MNHLQLPQRWLASLLGMAVLLTPQLSLAGAPTDQIRVTVDKAVAVLKDPGLRTESRLRERRELLRRVLLPRFDFTEMAKRSLGANWRKRTPKEQDEFVRLFTDLLERAYVDTIESYTGEKLVYVGEKLDGQFAEVASKIITVKGEEFSIIYKAHIVGGDWKIYDVVVENISMVNNYRSQFNRVIAKSSYEELIRRLRDKQGINLVEKN